MKEFFRRLRYRLFPCKHEWVQAAEFWHNKTGENYDYLLPSPMEHYSGYQSNCYICKKCFEEIITIEKIENANKQIKNEI